MKLRGYDDSCGEVLSGVVEGFYGKPWTMDQRTELFKWMNEFQLNTFMYAPKDDAKHRALWREMYTVEEAEVLKTLITAAKRNGISFVYAISPGLDIVYSSQKEMQLLKRKLAQVSEFGCEAFAMLFDDIEPRLNEADIAVFPSLAAAQSAVSNAVYEHLSQPLFLFCPTEYCASRAVPSVEESEYLNTIGTKLQPGIDIMWTGPRVISKRITVESLKQVEKVLKRPAVLWDNYHANDYDQRRLYLGPWAGRSTEILPHIRGCLSNPNCEFEANYIPLHTMAQWLNAPHSQVSVVDPLVGEEESPDEVKSITDAGDAVNVDCTHTTAEGCYYPRRALAVALKDWMTRLHVYVPCAEATYRASTSIPESALEIPTVKTCVSSTPVTNTVVTNLNELTLPKEDVQFTPIDPLAYRDEQMDDEPLAEQMQVEDSDSDVSVVAKDERMECSLLPVDDSAPNPETNRLGTTLLDSPLSKHDSPLESPIPLDAAVFELSEEDMMLVIELYYLPFEHGPKAAHLLNEVHWLISNGHFASRSADRMLSDEWRRRVSDVEVFISRVKEACDRLYRVKNRAAVQYLHPYLYDTLSVLSVLSSYLHWLGCTKGYRAAFMSGENEPWLFQGGVAMELQRILPMGMSLDVSPFRCPVTPTTDVAYTRPYQCSDEEQVYKLFLQNWCGETSTSSQYDKLICESRIGGVLTLSAENCFVTPDSTCPTKSAIKGYVLTVLDVVTFTRNSQIAWVPALVEKYPKPSEDEKLGLTQEEVLNELHSSDGSSCSGWFGAQPDELVRHFPSVLHLAVHPEYHLTDPSLPKRLFSAAAMVLKSHGSSGVHVSIRPGESQLFELYQRLGFCEYSSSNKNCVYMVKQL